MATTSPEENKILTLKAFDALFNKRDYAAAESFWSPDYIQHSAHIPPAAMACSVLFAHFRGHSVTKIT